PRAIRGARSGDARREPHSFRRRLPGAASPRLPEHARARLLGERRPLVLALLRHCEVPAGLRAPPVPRAHAPGDRKRSHRAQEARMKILAIVVNYRTAEQTLEATESLVQALSGMDGRVAVVDNDSQDGSYELLSHAVGERGWTNRVEVLRAPKN